MVVLKQPFLKLSTDIKTHVLEAVVLKKPFLIFVF